MTMTDPVADYLTRVRNAILAKHKRVDIPASSFKLALTKLLQDNDLITGYTVVEHEVQGTIRIQLKYTDGHPAISGLKRVSRPGLRKYVPADDIPRVLGGLGVGVISTSQGLMTDKEARHAGVGGEFLCEIW
jgi:small subunit ribosomal protein S8